MRKITVTITRERNGRVEILSKKVNLKSCPKGLEEQWIRNPQEARICSRLERQGR